MKTGVVQTLTDTGRRFCAFTGKRKFTMITDEAEPVLYNEIEENNQCIYLSDIKRTDSFFDDSICPPIPVLHGLSIPFLFGSIFFGILHKTFLL